MNETAHTPGPWTATPIAQGTGDFCIHAKGVPWQLAYLAESSQIEWPIEANARLIASAPDMYEALRIVQRGIAKGKIEDQSLLRPTPDGGDVDMVPLSSIIDRAIAKATGEPS